jgi:hypothetical protein
LRVHESEFRALGVQSLSLFGSQARALSQPNSDVDVTVHLGDAFSRGGFDCFSSLDDLETRFSGMLGCKVGLVEEPIRTLRSQEEIDRNRATAF